VAVPTTVVTGEGVAFELPRAGIGSRTVAAIVDLSAQFLALLLLVFIDSLFAGGSDSAALDAVLVVELVLVIAGYPIVCEWLTRGRTLGKLWLGLRVVRDDGGPITFRHALVRGLFGLVLEKPGISFGSIALITMAGSQRDKRLGDMVAGSFVLNERAGTSRRPVLQEWWVPPELRPWAASLDLSRLDDRLALSLRQFVSRAPMMTPGAQHALGEQLRQAVFAVVAPPPPPHAPTPPVLVAVLAERRRRAAINAAPGAAVVSASFPPPGPPPPPGPFTPPS
jgi:uncharacterized RDD family membrane protein YckC